EYPVVARIRDVNVALPVDEDILRRGQLAVRRIVSSVQRSLQDISGGSGIRLSPIRIRIARRLLRQRGRSEAGHQEDGGKQRGNRDLPIQVRHSPAILSCPT